MISTEETVSVSRVINQVVPVREQENKLPVRIEPQMRHNGPRQQS